MLTSKQIRSIVNTASNRYYAIKTNILLKPERNFIQMNFKTDAGEFIASASCLGEDKEALMRMCIQFGMEVKAVLDAQDAVKC